MPATRDRGYILLAVLIVLSVATLLVAGAITFTGTERSASVLRTRDDRLSACAQAARNLFLSQLRVLQGNIEEVSIDAGVPYGNNGEIARLQRRHYTLPDGGSFSDPYIVEKLKDDTVAGSSSQVADSSNRVGKPPLMAGYYRVTVLCQEKTDGPEREIEFVVRVGI